jgi:hypothetical protein
VVTWPRWNGCWRKTPACIGQDRPPGADAHAPARGHRLDALWQAAALGMLSRVQELIASSGAQAAAGQGGVDRLDAQGGGDDPGEDLHAVREHADRDHHAAEEHDGHVEHVHDGADAGDPQHQGCHEQGVAEAVGDREQQRHQHAGADGAGHAEAEAEDEGEDGRADQPLPGEPGEAAG